MRACQVFNLIQFVINFGKMFRVWDKNSEVVVFANLQGQATDCKACKAYGISCTTA